MSLSLTVFSGLADVRARADAEALAEGIAGVVRLAAALLSRGNRIDLTGLDALFGLLCARALDLEPDHGRALQPKLLTLRDDLDALFAAFLPGGLN